MPNTSLQQFIQNISGEDHTRVQDDLGNGFVRLRAAEAQRRQAKQDIRSFEDVVIEMLRNARDANAKAIFIATWSTKEQRFLTMLDDGDGVPLQLQDTIFEPFVTSKLDSFHADRWGVHGRGMALYSIRQNTDSARVIASAPGLGSIFSVVSSFSRLSEKRDQSSAPSVTVNEDGKPVLRGPHNIMRTVLEFAIDERDGVAVYLGSPAEIVSTLVIQRCLIPLKSILAKLGGCLIFSVLVFVQTLRLLRSLPMISVCLCLLGLHIEFLIMRLNPWRFIYRQCLVIKFLLLQK